MLDVSELWWPPRPDNYSVYDVTAFVHQHPGADLIITDAAEEVKGHLEASLATQRHENQQLYHEIAVLKTSVAQAAVQSNDAGSAEIARLKRELYASADNSTGQVIV